MTPRFSIIAASIRKALGGLAGDIGKYADEYWNSVVLALRGNVPVQDFKTETVLNMHMDGADPDWANVVLGMHMGGGEVDPYWSSVSFLLLMNGSNGNAVVGDVTGKTVTIAGNAAISMTQSKFGGASCYFDGTGDVLSIPSGTWFDLASGDFTMESWVWTASSTDQTIMARRETGATGWVFGVKAVCGYINGAWSDTLLPCTPTLSTWQHHAFVRSGGTLYRFLDGVIIGSMSISGSMSDPAGIVVRLGSSLNSGEWYMNGYLDNVRFTKGVARYTDRFTPPNREFPAGATTIYDVKGHPVTVNGNTAIVSTQSRFGGYSCYFDGAGDYLSTPSTSDLAFGTGDYCIEAWVYLSALGTERCLLDTRAATSDTGVYLYVSATNYPTLFGNNAAIVTGSSTLSATTWYHLAAVKVSGTVTLYLNGVSIGSASSAYTVTCPGAVVIGRKIGSTSNDWSGYLDDLRVTKGTGRYTGAFTPPSRAFPHDLAFFDQKNKVPAITGTPSISTGTLKYGYGSASFNGTTDYLTFDASKDFGLSTADFTIEAWIKTSAAGTLLDFRNYASDYGHFYLATGGYLAFDHTYGAIVGTTSVTDNAWHHVAFVRYKGILTLYVDGADSGAAIANANIGSNRQARVGAKVDGTNFFAGNLDELRVTKVARYVGEFTPQRYAFEDTNNNRIWQDETSTKTVTPYGNAQVYPATYKFGNGSMYFDGVGDYLTVPTSTEWDFGSGNFTIEAWIYKQAGQTDPHIVCLRNAGTTVAVRLQIGSGGQARGSCIHTSTNYGLVTGTTVLANNTWHHLAYVRHSNNHMIIVNGVIESSNLQSHTIPVDTLVCSVGHLDGTTASYAFAGFIDDLRITKGIARYVSNFTPPVRQNANYGLPAIYDPYWDAVVLGMHMDGADAGVTFTDVKGKTVSVFGNAQTKTATKKFGTASAYFDGTGDYLSTPTTTDLAFGTGDYSIEAWVYLSTLGTERALLDTRAATTDTGLYLYVSATNFPTLFGNNAAIVTGSTALVASAWYHLAAVKVSGTVTLYLNGVSIGSAASAYTVTCPGSVVIGRKIGSTTNDWSGYLDDLRITRGVARYTANFQPAQYAFPETRTPVKTYLDPYYDSVVLNMHMNGPSGSAAFVDEKGKVVTAVGNAALSSTQSKFGGTSVYFDGTGDYLTIPTSTDFDFGAGDFTVEYWVNPTSTASTQVHLCRRATAAARGFTTEAEASGVIAAYLGDSNTSGYEVVLTSPTGTLVAGAWHHIAVSRITGVTKLLVNGVVVASSSAAVTIDSAAATFYIGIAEGTTAPFTGYIDDLRITKGVGRYSQSFTIPVLPNPDYKTAPAATDPYWKNVVLHLPMNGADLGTTFTENTGKTVTAYGNACTKVAQYRFGGASAYFDGTGDRIAFPISEGFNFGTGDYTVEFWYYPVSAVVSDRIIQSRDGDLYPGLYIAHASSTTLTCNASVDGTTFATGGTTVTISQNKWNHVAFVRSGGVISGYVNGILSGSPVTISGSLYYSASDTVVIGGQTSGKTINGYLDDFRVTKGVARYTSTFTPPSLPNPTGYDPYAPNVVLHLPMATDFNDGTGKTVTVNGDTVISTTVKKLRAGSGYFDGSGDSVTFANSSDLNFGTGDFTVECWCLNNAYTTVEKVVASTWQNTTTGWTMQFTTTAAGKKIGWNSTGDTFDLQSTDPVSDGVWHHLAFSRASGTLRCFVDGVLNGSVADASNITSTASTYIGGFTGYPNMSLNGYLSDLRITKGVARYTADFTPPREPFALV